MENEEKYKKEKVNIDLYWANVFAIILLIPTVIIYGLPYYLIWKDTIHFKDFSLPHFFESSWVFIIAMIIGIIAHELIHGAVWAVFAKNGFKSIKFGIIWKMITPYCHCKEPLKVRQYALGAIMPAIILGFIPAIWAIIMGNIGLLILGMFFTVAAGGDFLIIHALRKEKKDTLIEDHPSEVGYFAYRLNGEE